MHASKVRTISSAATLACLAFPSCAGGERPSPSKPIDYSHPTTWICRPGADQICTSGLQASVLERDGTQTEDPARPAASPAIDCFYLYPTVSNERQPYADMTLSPEIAEVTKQQVGRLSGHCRLFAPIYRQVTDDHLRHEASGGEPNMWDPPLQDVIAAFRYYLKHDNQGRGVVLIGHSQGSILLQALIAGGIDGQRLESLLVSAFLAGDLSLAVPKGRMVGGTFKHVPLCSAASQVGCVYVWGSYSADDSTPKQMFGSPRADGLVSACANPAAPGGGDGALKVIYPRDPWLPPGITPYIEINGALHGACREQPSGNGFRVSVWPGIRAKLGKNILERARSEDGWGLHMIDVLLVEGNVLDVIDAETKTWLARHATSDMSKGAS